MALTTAFLSVFQQRLEKDIESLRTEIKKPKKERNKDSLKRLVKDCKELKSIVYAMQEDTKKCPNCGYIKC